MERGNYFVWEETIGGNKGAIIFGDFIDWILLVVTIVVLGGFGHEVIRSLWVFLKLGI